MKTEISLPAVPPAPKLPYPKLRRPINESNRYVVLFTARTTGVVVWADHDARFNQVGEYTTEWASEMFEDVPVGFKVCLTQS